MATKQIQIGDTIKDINDARLPDEIGTDGQVLKSDGTNIVWGDASGGGSVLYQHNILLVFSTGRSVFTLITKDEDAYTIDTLYEKLSNYTSTYSYNGVATGFLYNTSNYLIFSLGKANSDQFNFGVFTYSNNSSSSSSIIPVSKTDVSLIQDNVTQLF